MSTFLENQNWRYATKKFDANKKVSQTDLDFLKEAIRLSASSFGLQLYKIIIVENTEIREKLLPAAYGQGQIVDASHLIVFANQTNFDDSDIENYLDNATQTRNLPQGTLSGYGDYIKGALGNLPQELRQIWTAKQTYLALGNLLAAAAEIKVDATPMEGFNPQQFNEILGLDKLNLNASVIAAVGYRSEDDAAQHYKKVRKSNQDLFITI
jgi:nitroreductase